LAGWPTQPPAERVLEGWTRTCCSSPRLRASCQPWLLIVPLRLARHTKSTAAHGRGLTCRSFA